jgi:nucleoside-diphosphate-sugar epimerase
MRVFVAAGTGAIGRRLVPLLVAVGHEVVGLARSREGSERLRRAGATAVEGDALDRDAVLNAVIRAEPEVVVHELTAFSRLGTNLRRFEREVAETNRLRTEGTDILRAAAVTAGARRFVAQSFAGWTYARAGGPVKTEADPLDPDPLAATRGAWTRSATSRARRSTAPDRRGSFSATAPSTGREHRSARTVAT